MTKTTKKPNSAPFSEVSEKNRAGPSGLEGLHFEHELARQIETLVRVGDGASEEEVDLRVMAVCEAVESLAPRDRLESMLSVQMIATHHAALECVRRSMLRTQAPEFRDYNLRYATKRMTLFARQLEVLDRLRKRAAAQIPQTGKSS